MSRPKVIGIVGGGQLGRMLTEAAKPLGFDVVVLDTKRGSPAAQVGAKEIVIEKYDEAALQKLAAKADYITTEFEESLDTYLLESISKLGKPVNPAPQTIRLIQNKFEQKTFLREHGVPMGPFTAIENIEHAKLLRVQSGGKMLIKTRTGGYDGNGNMVVTSDADVENAFKTFKGRALYAESFIPFKKELAVMIAKGLGGEVSLYPVVETIQQRNICLEVLAPAQISKKAVKKAEALARQVAEHLEGAGVFGIEMFLTNNGTVLLNEVAPRVHNSGHYTIDACITSQFEQHIRAITGLPLGCTEMVTPAAVMINILGEQTGPTELKNLDKALAEPDTHVNVYGKSPTKIDRKMGHINATGKSIKEAQTRAARARKVLEV